ncbi:MAG: hypothetical protein A4E67_00231 [Syntrophaceae bacterium PtaB.Bin038]|nr:MAG: hypothetical protein A4E67_00231 [Syntrophaceae bacterium PtaB.Bin038]
MNRAAVEISAIKLIISRIPFPANHQGAKHDNPEEAAQKKTD